MNSKQRATLDTIFVKPPNPNIRWTDIESLFVALGATIQEREGSRIAVIFNGSVMVFHRPHPRPETDRGAVVSVRRWLEENGVQP